MTLKNSLLVIIDDDLDEISALGRATQLAEGMGATIELFCCVFDPEIAAQRLFDSEDLLPAKHRRLKEQRRRLEDIARPLRSEGFDVTVDVEWDEPVYEGIVRKVMRSQPRLVLRSNRHHDGSRRGFFSNDDWNLMRHCPVPLMMTRPTVDEDDAFHVCAAIDPMHEHDKPASLDYCIVAAAEELAALLNGKLTVLHCYDPAPAIASLGEGTMMPVIADVKEITQQVRDAHWEATRSVIAGVGLDESVIAHLEGNAKTLLPPFAVDEAVDVLVMGAISRGFWQRHIIGNTAEKVLDRLPCDLLIIKPAEFATGVGAKSSHRVTEDAA
ncbi:MAG: universal stress protein [Pseudomonadota bacterium]